MPIKLFFYLICTAVYPLVCFVLVPLFFDKVVLRKGYIGGDPVGLGFNMLLVTAVLYIAAFIVSFFVSRNLFGTFWPALISLGAGLLLTLLISLFT